MRKKQKQPEKITHTAYVLVHKRTGRVMVEAGIDFRLSEIKPNEIYEEEYAVAMIEIPFYVDTIVDNSVVVV